MLAVCLLFYSHFKKFLKNLFIVLKVNIVIVTISELSKLLSFIAFTDSMMKVLKAWEEETVQKVVDNPRRI